MITEHRVETTTGKEVVVRVADDRTQMGWIAANLFRQAWVEKGEGPFVAGLPTGNTPIPFYQALVGMFLEREIDFGRVWTFNLDEYMDLPPCHPNSYRMYMEDHLFRYTNLARENIHFPNGMTRDWRRTCERYEEMIRRAGGIDLQVLGVGVNGHIAFNEPGTERNARTRMVRLAERTLHENARLFPDPKEAPTFALTMGIGTILEARAILLLAAGSAKANAVYESLLEPPGPRVPASFLQTFDGDCSFVLDRKAAAELPLGGC